MVNHGHHSELIGLLLEHLAPLGTISARAMFGGYGIYRDDTIFAIVVNDTLYFKTDEHSAAEFTALGLRPFTYAMRGKTIAMSYYEAPPEVFEEPEVMQQWAKKALSVRKASSRKRSGGKVDQSRE